MARVLRSSFAVCLLGLTAVSALFAADAPAVDPAALAAQVKAIFRNRCSDCHGEGSTQGDIDMLNHAELIGKKNVVAGAPESSPVYVAIINTVEDARMPQGLPALPPAEVDTVRQWILAGAPAFPDDVAVPVVANPDPALQAVAGVDHVLKSILAHQRTLSLEDRRFIRYFSSNHLLARGASREELDLQFEALAKAINHLTYEPVIVKPLAIDGPTATVFAVDLRRLGWHKTPYINAETKAKSAINLWDLILLEYPYSIIYEDSQTYDTMVLEYMKPAGMVRPICYIRTDWFASVATLPPLYHDIMQLPHTLQELEKKLGVDSQANIDNRLVARAGMIVSGVSRNNRAVERHPLSTGFYWKSVDYATSKGTENIFTDPINLVGAGGEMIFTLPNGLQGYYLATSKGDRLDAGPTEIVTDKFAEDKVVRNGLSCIRCHDQGMKGFKDDVRVAAEQLPGGGAFNKREILALYPPKADMDALVEADKNRFLAATQHAIGKPLTQEALIPVSQRFLDSPLQLSATASELGLADPSTIKAVFRQPQFTALGMLPLAAGRAIRRDMFEDFYDQIVRAMAIGTPVVPIDGATRREYRPLSTSLQVVVNTSKKNNVFQAGDTLSIEVKNNGKAPVFVEMIGTGVLGEKNIMVPAKTTIQPGASLRFPEKGEIKVQPALGKEQITIYASETEFPAGVVIRGAEGSFVSDRVIHPFYQTSAEGKGVTVAFDAAKVLKHTIDIETR